MTEVNRIKCIKCEDEHPETLFSPGDGFCCYCKADAAERGALRAESDKEAAAAPVKPSQSDIARAALAQRELCRRSLLPYMEQFTPNYQAGWVHKDMCRRLEKFSKDVVDRKSPRLMLFCPPRVGKSAIGSIGFPGWHIGQNPSHEFISCAYAGDLALTFSRKVRNHLKSPAYKNIFKTRLDPKSQASGGWITTEGGGYVAAGVGGGITGKGAHILMIDDPVKNREEAESQNTREANWDWYTSTAYTRLAPGGGILVIMTRWHDDDLAGRLLQMEATDQGDSWEVVRYPAIAEEDEEFRKKGEALHPERYDIEALNRIQRAVGPRDWEALYQQNPVADDGDYFTRDMIKYFTHDDMDVDELTYYQAWDLAIGKNDRNDYTVGITVGVDSQDRMYVVDLIRDRLDGLEIVEAILDQFELWRPKTVGIERGHIDMAIGPLLEKRKGERNLYECFTVPLKTGRRDKEMRARAIQGRMQQGKVLFPANEKFTGPLVSELLRFPNGVHDDQVDALSWIGLMMADFSMYLAPSIAPPASWRDTVARMVKPKKTRSSMSA